MKISIKARIQDYDNFFKRNFTDNRISLFEKQKFRLRKLIHESNDRNKEPRELDIRFSIDNSINVAKHMALKQERPKTPAKVKTTRSANIRTEIQQERSKSPLKTPNTLVKVKMTKEEYEEYMRQAANKQKDNQNLESQNPFRSSQPVSKRIKPPSSIYGRSPVRSKRV